SIHVVTLVSRHRKRTPEDVRPMLAPSETLPLKEHEALLVQVEVDSHPKLCAKWERLKHF
nr:hypothetical protein [Tanacetum cinerariifolium]